MWTRSGNQDRFVHNDRPKPEKKNRKSVSHAHQKTLKRKGLHQKKNKQKIGTTRTAEILEATR